MTIYLPEVRKISHDFMSLPVFNPNVFSEDEDDLPGKKEIQKDANKLVRMPISLLSSQVAYTLLLCLLI